MPKGVYIRTDKIKNSIKIARLNNPISEETRKKLSESHKGKKPNKQTRIKMSLSQKGRIITWGDKISKAKQGELNAMWKGGVSWYSNIHQWIEKKLGKPSFCEICKRTDKKKYEWSNKDHKYKKDIKDWQRLCTQCHRKYDYKFNPNKLIKGDIDKQKK